MRIISKFKDYYDIGLSYGIDPKLIYERKEKKYNIPNINIDQSRYENDRFMDDINLGTTLLEMMQYMDRYDLDRHSDSFIIGFCGEIYYGKRVQFNIDEFSIYKFTTTEYDFIYTLDDLLKMVSAREKLIGKSSIKKFYTDKTNPEYDHYVSFTKHNYSLWLKKLQTKYNNILQDFFVKYKTPIFVIEKDELRTNISLKDYEFYRMKDPYTAFQDISQFLSGILGMDDKPMVEISNNDRVIKHGFDHKYAFRKEP